MLKLASHSYKESERESIDSSTTSQWFDAKVVSIDQPQTARIVSLSPVETILRAHLPLSWLSNDSKHEILCPGIYLQADIQSVSRWEYSVLVARCVRYGGLYALEKIEVGTYVCFPLRDFVTIELVRQATIGAIPHLDISILQLPTHRSHRRTSSINNNTVLRGPKDEPASPKIPQNRRGMLARQSILSKQPNDDVIADDHLSAQLPQRMSDTATLFEDPDIGTVTLQKDVRDERHESIIMNNAVNNDQTESNKPGEPVTLGPGKLAEEETPPVDQLSPEYLRKRYLEMLYLSKTSLAFYAKGPLGRTRARARVDGASMDLSSLANFYRDSILPIKKLDMKYKQSLLAKISSLNASHVIESDDNEPSTVPSQPPKTKKSRRTKLGKDALWPIEGEFIEKWWYSRERTDRPTNTPEALRIELERKTSLLRLRETELQVLLILEVLAIEAQQANKEADVNEPGQSIKIESTEATAAGKIPNAISMKKKRDLKLDLEVLLDKLCILHSVGFEDLGHGQPADDGERRGPATGMRDDLKDFCKDVVVPFYSGKLPDECKHVCQKLGGLQTSPHRRKPTEDRSNTPGTVISNRASTSSKRTLDRVLSEEHGLRNVPPPALSRSSTLPPSANFKREPSERPMSRGGVQKSLSFTNREIDLVADAQMTAAKRRKLDRIAAQKRELEAAINVLKKPNRTAAAQTFMDDIERRSTESKVPGRRNEPVQITATPKISRTKSVSVDEYELPPMVPVTSRSEMAYVPSSTTKPRGLGHISSMAKSSAKKKAVLSAIHNTPLRERGPKQAGTDPETETAPSTIPELPNQSSSTLVDSTPALSRLRPDLIQTILSTPVQAEKGQKMKLFTPTKRPQLNVEDVFKDIPELRDRATQMMDRAMKVGKVEGDVSIYDSLGWNDDDDDYDI